MKTLFLNNVDAHLMIWETNPRKRKINNEIKLVVPEDQPLNNGDLIVGSYSENHISAYEIEKITDKRKSALSKKNYITALVKWTSKKPLFKDYKVLANNNFKKLYNLQ